MSAQSDPRRQEATGAELKYYYRRRLSARELLPALGAAVGAGVVAFYVAKLLLERTPLRVESGAGDTPGLTPSRSSRSSTAARNAGRR
jgi:hypothetical protein